MSDEMVMSSRRGERHKDPSSAAVDTLVRSGRRVDVAELYDTTAARAQRQYAEIRKDTTRTPECQAAELKRTYEVIRADLTEKVIEMARGADRDDRQDAVRVFGVAGLSGDAASLAISARDAADRTAQTTDSEGLLKLLERATRVGDEVLARAVVQRAVEDGLAGIVNAFTDARPELRDTTERLWSRARNEDAGSFDLVMKLLAVRPA